MSGPSGQLFVANCTQQDQDFLYRLPEQPGAARMQRIPVGGQVRIAGRALSVPEIEAIIRQHERYGMAAVENIDRTREFHGLCYSVGKPVSIPQMRKLLEVNHAALVADGIRRRREAAVVTHDELEKASPGLSATNVEIREYVELNDPRSPDINEGFRITPSEDPGPSGGPTEAARSGQRGKKRT